MSNMNAQDIIIKKEDEGDVFNLYQESSDESVVEFNRKRPKLKTITQHHNKRTTSKSFPTMNNSSSSVKPMSSPENPSVHTIPQQPPSTTLKDDMFEVFTNPDKKRVMDESDEEEQPEEDPIMEDDYYPQHSNQFDAYEDEAERPSAGFNSIEEEKQDYLYKFYRLQSKGVPVSKKFNMQSNVSEMRNEYNRIKRDAEVNGSIRFSRRMLMACVTGIEFLNKRYDPFDIKLDGWSESVMENVDDYDNVFERLHDKYSSKVSMAPEIELLLSLAGSAFMFHLTNSMFNSIPNIKDIAKQNPDIIKNMMQSMSAAAANHSSTNTPPQQPSEQKSNDANTSFREMNPPMFDVSSIMNMIQPPQSFTPVGNQTFPMATRSSDVTITNPSTHTNIPVTMHTNPIASPSIISSSSSDNNERSFSDNNRAKTISFSETSTVGGTKRRRGGRNKIQSTSENTITI